MENLKYEYYWLNYIFGNTDLLLLDEPTFIFNNLETIKWLEDFLAYYENTVIVIYA